MNTTEFDEIRPYNDEELPGVFEELIADPAFQKVVAGVIPDVPFEMLAQKMRACKIVSTLLSTILRAIEVSDVEALRVERYVPAK